jgi:hypothetical protein
MESYGGVQRLACDEGGRCAWEARRPRGLAVSKGDWPAGRMNGTALVSGRASSRRTRVLLGLAVVGGEGWTPACPSVRSPRAGQSARLRAQTAVYRASSTRARGPVGGLSLGSGHCIGADAAQSKREYGQFWRLSPPELGKVPRRRQGSSTDESITGWETIPHQQTSTGAVVITGRSPHPR